MPGGGMIGSIHTITKVPERSSIVTVEGAAMMMVG